MIFLNKRFDYIKERKAAKIRIRYNQIPHLTQDTTWESDETQFYITNKSQEVSPFPVGDHMAATNRWKKHKKHKTLITQMIHAPPHMIGETKVILNSCPTFFFSYPAISTNFCSLSCSYICSRSLSRSESKLW